MRNVFAIVLILIFVLSTLVFAQTVKVSNMNNGDGFEGVVSGNGRYVCYVQSIGSSYTYQILVYDRINQTRTRVDVSSDGVASNGASEYPSISDDGRYVAFESTATNLVDNDTNAKTDIFIRDTILNTTIRASVSSIGIQGNDNSKFCSISGDGKFVVFQSNASNLIASDLNAKSDYFLYDIEGSTTERVSVGDKGQEGNRGVGYGPAAISYDGKYIAFGSYASNLVSGTTGVWEIVYLRDRINNQTTVVSLTNAGAQMNLDSSSPSMSSDGSLIAFVSASLNFAPNITSNPGFIFLRNLKTSETSLIPVSSNGIWATKGSFTPFISGNGRYVAYLSDSDNLVEGDTNAKRDVFMLDRTTNKVARISISSTLEQGNDNCWPPVSVSSDGRYAVFMSAASNMVSGDTAGTSDVFLRDTINDFNGLSIYISSVSPELIQNGAKKTIVITGKYFDKAASVILRQIGKSDIVGSSVAVASNGESLSVAFDLTVTEAGQWDLIVTNPSKDYASRVIIIYDELAIVSVSPNELLLTEPRPNYILSITGKGFSMGTIVKLKKSGSTDLAATKVGFSNHTNIDAYFDFAGSEAPGYWDMQITNELGASVTLEKAFNIKSFDVTQIVPTEVGAPGFVTVKFHGFGLDSKSMVKLTKTDSADIIGENIESTNNQADIRFNMLSAIKGEYKIAIKLENSNEYLDSGKTIKVVDAKRNVFLSFQAQSGMRLGSTLTSQIIVSNKGNTDTYGNIFIDGVPSDAEYSLPELTEYPELLSTFANEAKSTNAFAITSQYIEVGETITIQLKMKPSVLGQVKLTGQWVGL